MRAAWPSRLSTHSKLARVTGSGSGNSAGSCENWKRWCASLSLYCR
jgi:hypothetical protein